MHILIVFNFFSEKRPLILYNELRPLVENPHSDCAKASGLNRSKAAPYYNIGLLSIDSTAGTFALSEWKFSTRGQYKIKFKVFMNLALTAVFGTWNAWRSLGEAKEAFAPEWVPKFEEPASLSWLDKKRLLVIQSNYLKNETFRLVSTNNKFLASAHGNSTNGIIGINKLLLRAQNPDPKYLKYNKDTCVDSFIDDWNVFEPFINYFASRARETGLEKKVSLLSMGLNKEEMQFVIDHEKFHLTDNALVKVCRISGIIRLIGFCAAEYIGRSLTSNPIVHLSMHTAFYSISCVAIASFRRRHELKADSASFKKNPSGARRFFKRMLILQELDKTAGSVRMTNTFWVTIKNWVNSLSTLEERMAEPPLKERLKNCSIVY